MRPVETLQQPPPVLRRAVGLHQCECHGQLVLLRDLPQPREFRLHLIVVGCHLEHPVACLLDGACNAQDLVGRGERARRELAGLILVDEGARGREPQRTGLQSFLHRRHHPADVVGRRLVVRDAALSHHIGAQRRMGNLRADVDRARHPREGVEVLGKRLPVPAYAFGQHRSGDVLHALHHADQPVAPIRLHRCEPHAAVAHDDARDAMVRGGTQVGIPRRLPVEMRMHIDPARRNQRAVDAKLPGPGTELAAHGRDLSVANAEVALERWRSRSIDDAAATNYGIKHAHASFNPDEYQRP